MHGKAQVLARTKGFKGQAQSRANMANKEETMLEATKPNKEDFTEFNKEDIERLRCLLDSLDKSSSCSLVKF
ncbi:unnamed protein product, partial [Dovyalis caffra]